MTTTQRKNIEKRLGYKHTPLGWIPEEWELKEIGEFAPLQRGFDLTNSNLEKGEYPVVYSNGIMNYHSCYKATGPGVVTGRSGTIGKVTYVEDNYWPHNTSLWVTNFNDNLPKYVYYFYQNLRLERFGTGSGVPTLNRNDVHSHVIGVPPLPEQRKIAAILSTWDEAIQQTQALIKQLGKRNKGLAQQLLKAKKEWKEIKMSALFERITNKNEEGNDNVVTISAQRGFVKQETFFKKRVASDTLHNYFLVDKGDFCYNKSYSTGYDWGATKRLKDFDKAVVTTLYICFRIKEETKTSGAFFEHFFETGILDKGLSKIAHEGGRAHGLLNVTPRDFFSLKISVPNIKEQQAIAAVLDKADEELKQQEQYLTALQQQKKGLMQQLLTGAVRVKIDNV